MFGSITYSSSTNSSDSRVSVSLTAEFSITPLFGVRKVTFSSVTPPRAVAILVVSSPAVTCPDSEELQTAPVPPTVTHSETALHVVTRSAYSRVNTEGEEVVAPSLLTANRSRSTMPANAPVTGTSSTPPVFDVASVSLPSSFLKW